MLPATIREKDERYSVALEEGKGFIGSWEGIGTPEEHSIDAIGISITVHNNAETLLGYSLKCKREI